ncbi:MAG: hydrogenase maturation protease [Limimaricola sp.]|uniref:hydrogenase maturation protease n=1 Tax=Limimaricola sp. TaxID=2211665 RepID=UPI001DD949E3|nr:hydrogenase maturation protease [Limimaricola sp.]MBI1418144.1 hydrogenase maturation protease [Limimaricola sp.]
MSDILFVGVGNRWRRDDGVGPVVAQALAGQGARAMEHGADGAGLIELFATAPAVVLIDATRSGAAPGTVQQFDAAAGPLQADLFHYSTHRFGLAEAVETARALGDLPARLVVWGIEGADFGPGEGLSASVDMAARALVTRLKEEMGPW